MATSRYYGDMLNEYLTERMLKEEITKRMYFLNKCKKDDGWKGGTVPVSFKAAKASSVKFGGLTDSADISRMKATRGSITDYREVWASLLIDSTDLAQHQDGRIPEDTFLKILPDAAEELLEYMKTVMSIQLQGGPYMSVVTDDTNRATGVMVVTKIDRFELDQHLVIDDNNSGSLDVYVIAINVNTNEVTFSATRGGAFVDLSAYTVAQGAKLYYDGVTDGAGNFSTFTSMRDVLLSQANGGSATVHGVNKLTGGPILQSVNVDGSSINASNILGKLFDAWVAVKQKAKGGKQNEFLMSYKHWASVMKLLEAQKGPYVVTKAPNQSLYGWTSVSIASTTTGQSLDIVGVQEADDDVICMPDWSTIEFMSNGFIRKHKDPEGKEFYVTRSTTGYKFITDLVCYGEVKYSKPGQSGIIYGVSY